MTEEISLIYDNVDIKAWAQSIREIKIREFQELIAKRKSEFDALIAKQLGDCTLQEAIDLVTESTHLGTRLVILIIKLDMLKAA